MDIAMSKPKIQLSQIKTIRNIRRQRKICGFVVVAWAITISFMTFLDLIKKSM